MEKNIYINNELKTLDTYINSIENHIGNNVEDILNNITRYPDNEYGRNFLQLLLRININNENNDRSGENVNIYKRK